MNKDLTQAIDCLKHMQQEHQFVSDNVDEKRAYEESRSVFIEWLHREGIKRTETSCYDIGTRT